MKSTQQKLAQCEGLLGTKDLTKWETEFIEDLLKRERVSFSEPVLEKLDEIWRKHFA